jgi:ATP-dependent Clp protease protease subunit
MRENLNFILATHTGQTVDQVEKDVERDRIMNAVQAKEYGILDLVIKHRE